MGVQGLVTVLRLSGGYLEGRPGAYYCVEALRLEIGNTAVVRSPRDFGTVFVSRGRPDPTGLTVFMGPAISNCFTLQVPSK